VIVVWIVLVAVCFFLFGFTLRGSIDRSASAARRGFSHPETIDFTRKRVGA
jgi:hypothetical protein